MIFIAGTDTEVGKTIVSAILLEALQGYYWKPVQAGTQPYTDTELVKRLTSLPGNHFLKEKYIFKTPASPHFAALKENITIDGNFKIPEGKTPLVIEGAGGLMVPLNNDFLFIDMIEKWKIPVLLVAKYYLGAINHTLLSLEVLKQRTIPVAGVVFNGNWKKHAKDIITHRNPELIFFKIKQSENKPDKDFVKKQADLLKESHDFKEFVKKC